ncbi:MAG: ribonucleoside triphosphate reductase [Alphaproteobacteria bacterium]|nr:ribonucleoside triphosphate reductase [Alphaproteobacteria bacterium]MBQ9234921.1 ribonucleoside triphosphate reductase [Alphaproteobacteria bacterium]
MTESTSKIPSAAEENIGIAQVSKRDGTLAPFDSNKIYNAICKAGASTKEFGEDESWLLTAQVLKVLKHKFDAKNLPSIEQIQDVVEQVLISANYFNTAKAYILYRDQRTRTREDKKVMVDVESSINEYLERLDWRINENANQGYSNGGLILNVSGKVTANYWLSHVYPAAIGEAHRNGDFHIHDLSMLAAYCAGWSLKNLLHEGFNGVPGKAEAGPAKHLSAAIGQMVNFMGTLQNEWAGAQAFSSVDTYLAPYIRKDKLSYKQVYQSMQELVYNLNVPSRWGSQTPFTNFTFDWVCPEDLRDKHPLIAGVEQPFTYGELQEEMHMINKAYMEVMMKGDIKGRPFTFPIPTYNMTPDFPWEDENTELLFEMTAKYGLPYFQNFINSVLKPGQIRSMCCRLQLDLRELLARGNGLFGSAEQTGSIGVVTINCARLGYVYKGNEAGLYARLDELLELAKVSLEIKRKLIQRLIDGGLFPYTKRYLGTLRNHFSTIGVNGMNEMIRNYTNDEHEIADEWGQNFAIKFLDYIRDKLVKIQEETGHMYNLEATPAEGATTRFARADKKRYLDIIQAGTKENPFYTNSSQLPVGYTDDPFEALDLQSTLQTKYTGGTVLHLYMGQRISSAKVCRDIVKRVLTNYRLPYITITPTFSICPKHGYISGEHKYCPICDEEKKAAKRAAASRKDVA